MTAKSRQLAEAREHLGAAEADFLGVDCDYHIDEGFGLLETLVDAGAADAAIACNVGATYFERLRRLLVSALSPTAIPEPTLKQLLRLAQALESTDFAGNSDMESLRKDVARRLLDKYLVGYSSEEKERQIQLLMERLEQEHQAQTNES
ncbi:MAG: hypothetical protein ACR2RB_06160 [Gammaproteobacteria bacterium]